MPSREILLHGLLEIEKYPIGMVTPQHGSIIKGRLVNYMTERLKGLELSFDNGERFFITISAGVVFHRQNESLQSLIQRADDRLYQAKEGGRNRVCVG